MITSMDTVTLIRPTVYTDDRGYFYESYTFSKWDVPCRFLQDNQSYSKKNVIRGMHFQKGQAKLVRCVKGVIFDVVVDIRKESPTFGQWKGFELSEVNHHQLFIPDGYAHGFAVRSEDALVLYKVSTEYDPALESGFRYDDPSVAIEWNIASPIVSERDRKAPLFGEVCYSGL